MPYQGNNGRQLMNNTPVTSFLLRKTSTISDEEFIQFRDFIYAKCGIWVDEKRKYLIQNRFEGRVAKLGMKSFSEYLKFLQYDANRDRELASVFELVTTNETSFFRDQKQLDAFTDHILMPVLAQQRAKNRFELNIWSAGCSSGEEPYTLAMILCEKLGPDVRKWRINILGCDLSLPMISKAKAGVYSEYAFKTTPETLRRKYFTPVDGGLKISPAVTSLVSFQQLNLNDVLALKRLPKSQVVFCRNVIIYFDTAMRKKVVSAFYDNLLPGGYLILGHSETLHGITMAFAPKFFPGAVAYLKS